MISVLRSKAKFWKPVLCSGLIHFSCTSSISFPRSLGSLPARVVKGSAAEHFLLENRLRLPWFGFPVPAAPAALRAAFAQGEDAAAQGLSLCLRLRVGASLLAPCSHP